MPFGSSFTYLQPGYAPESVGRASSPFNPPQDTFENEPTGTLGSCVCENGYSGNGSRASNSETGITPICGRCFSWWWLLLIAVILFLVLSNNSGDSE